MYSSAIMFAVQIMDNTTTIILLNKTSTIILFYNVKVVACSYEQFLLLRVYDGVSYYTHWLFKE